MEDYRIRDLDPFCQLKHLFPIHDDVRFMKPSGYFLSPRMNIRNLATFTLTFNSLRCDFRISASLNAFLVVCWIFCKIIDLRCRRNNCCGLHEHNAAMYTTQLAGTGTPANNGWKACLRLLNLIRKRTSRTSAISTRQLISLRLRQYPGFTYCG